MRHRFACIMALLGLVSCAYNEVDAPEPGTATLPVPTMSLETLRELYPGHAVAVEEIGPVVLSGYVTTSDRAGNFHRTFIIQDETGAVEIRAGLYDLHNLFRPGQRVLVEANGLTLGMGNGVLQLGLKTSTSQPDYFNHRVVLEKYVYRGSEILDIPPRSARPSDLQPEWCGRLVRIDGLYLDPPADTTWALTAAMTALGTPQNASLKFRTRPTDSVYVFTSGYATFAGEKVPSGRVSVQGILMRGTVNGREVYQIKMRDLDDVVPADH